MAGVATYNQTYHKVEDADGNEIMTKEIPDRRSTQPCHLKFRTGTCDRDNCPYAHNFNIQDHSRAALAPPANEAVSNVTAPELEQKSASIHYTGHDAEDSDDFDYAYDLGFSNQSVSCAKLGTPVDSRPYASRSHDISIVLSTLLVAGAICFVYPFLASASAGIVDTYVKTATAFLGSLESMLFLLLTTASLFSVFFNTTTAVYGQFSSAVRWMGSFIAKYQVILDCGCTFTMSGDKGLFVPSSLTSINESVGLAESGHEAKATHYGKISVGGQLIDALYVPDFRQTMISMGQLEKMGLRYTTIGNIRHFLTPNNSVFLSFELVANNLYILSSSISSNSASSA